MPTLEINLPEPLKAFVDDQIAAGNFKDASDYVQALLREAFKTQERARIDAQLIEAVDALDRGETTEMTKADWQRLRSEYEQRLKQRNCS